MNSIREGLESNMGKWDSWYANLNKSKPSNVHDDTTLKMATSFFNNTSLVEDWGCGNGQFYQFRPQGYRGVDGSKTPYADEIADLVKYRTHAPGILLKHVIEHNFEWDKILENALHSFTERMCLIVHTPVRDSGVQVMKLADNPNGVPDLSFTRETLMSIIKKFPQITTVEEKIVKTKTNYNVEHVFFLRK